MSWSLSSSLRRNFPGDPIHKHRGSTIVFSGISVPAAMIEPAPITAPFRMIDPIPMRQWSSIVHPCKVTEWPTVTYSPRKTPYCSFIPCSTLHGIHPDTGMFAEHHGADDLRGVVHVARRGDGRGNAFVWADHCST